MTAREFLQTKEIDDSVTFLISHAVKDDNTPFYHMEYRTTPIHPAHVWLRDNWADGYIVTNADHPTIDVTGIWYKEYKSHRLTCAMLSTEADLITIYGEKQGASMVSHYDKVARNQ